MKTAQPSSSSSVNDTHMKTAYPTTSKGKEPAIPKSTVKAMAEDAFRKLGN